MEINNDQKDDNNDQKDDNNDQKDDNNEQKNDNNEQKDNDDVRLNSISKPTNENNDDNHLKPNSKPNSKPINEDHDNDHPQKMEINDEQKNYTNQEENHLLKSRSTANVPFSIRLSYKQKPCFIVDMVQISARQRIYIGPDMPKISGILRGKIFNNINELCLALEIKTSNLSKYLFLVDENGQITDTSLFEHLKKINTTKIIKNKTSLPLPLPSSQISPKNQPVLPLKSPIKDQSLPPVVDILPESVLTLTTLEEPTEENIKKINQYDQNIFRPQQWLSVIDGSVSWVNKGNSSWNPVASCYSLIYYIYKILKWPLEDLRMVITYNKGAVKFSKVIGDVYKQYDIMDKFNESDILTKVLVWFIASMNSFGVIRPIFFQGSTKNAFKLAPLCSLRQKHEQLLYFVTWPMRIDSKHIHIFHNQTTIKKYEIQEFLNDLHVYGKGKKVLKMIPDWIYKIISLKAV